MAFLAAPIANPIDIDAGVEYWYVVAQQGGDSVTVVPATDFTLSVQGVSPAMLKLKFTGTALSIPTYHTITLRVGTGASEITQTLNFRVLADSLTQRVPNITNVAGQSVAPGATITIAITSDIPATYSVASESGLSLSYNAATNRLTGTAPTTSGFYPIVFVAHNGAYAYKRYFVLIVGTGIVPPLGGITINWATSPDLSRCLFDGDFTVAQLAGPPQFEIPFKVDPKPYAYKLPYWQYLSNYADIPLGTPGPLGGGYVGGTPGTFKSIGGGIIEFWREYAVVPDSRSEYESHVYSYQFFLFCLGAVAGLSEMPLTVNSRVQFDYFQTVDPNTIDLPRAPRAIQVQAGTCSSTIEQLNGWNEGTPTGTEVLAEDAQLKIWKPGIYERRQRFIRWLNHTDLFPI